MYNFSFINVFSQLHKVPLGLKNNVHNLSGRLVMVYFKFGRFELFVHTFDLVLVHTNAIELRFYAVIKINVKRDPKVTHININVSVSIRFKELPSLDTKEYYLMCY